MLHGSVLFHCRLSFRYLDFILIKMNPLNVWISPVFLNIKEEIVQKHVNRAHIYTDKQNSLMVVSMSKPVFFLILKKSLLVLMCSLRIFLKNCITGSRMHLSSWLF